MDEELARRALDFIGFGHSAHLLNLDDKSLLESALFIHTQLSSKCKAGVADLLQTYKAIQVTRTLKFSERNDWPSCLNCIDMAIIVAGPDDLLLQMAEYVDNKLPDVVPIECDALEEASTQSITTHPLPILEAPSVEEFMLMSQYPFLMKKCIDEWPALHRWKDVNYLNSIAGHRLVPVEIGKSYLDSDWTQNTVKLHDFLNELTSNTATSKNNAYLAQYDLLSAIPKLSVDVDELDYCYLDLPGNSGRVIRNIWIGGSGCYTPPHDDPYNNLFCQVVGKKLVKLESRHGATDIMTELVLEAGDCLFIPRGWKHEVLSLTYNISISHWL